MPKTIKEVKNLLTPKIVRMLNRYKSVLGPGKEFIVTIGVRETHTVTVEVVLKSERKLTSKDWERILLRKWKGNYRRILQNIWMNENKPTVVNFNETTATRERLNQMFKKSGLPFVLKSTVYGSSSGPFQIVRR